VVDFSSWLGPCEYGFVGSTGWVRCSQSILDLTSPRFVRDAACDYLVKKSWLECCSSD
jgi:hypothetical protein